MSKVIDITTSKTQQEFTRKLVASVENERDIKRVEGHLKTDYVQEAFTAAELEDLNVALSIKGSDDGTR